MNGSVRKKEPRSVSKARFFSYLCYALIKQNYFVILATTPAPTVLPPSRIAKRCPSSIAIGVMSFTLISMLSPGMHISTPSGRLMSPVTSVVLKKNCGRYPLKNGVWRPPSSLVRTYTCAVNSVCGCTVPGFASTCPLSMSVRSIPRSRAPMLSPAMAWSLSLIHISEPTRPY